MITVEEALDRILSTVHPLAPARMPILDALGLTLAEDVRADFDIPPWDNSAMDGYAVRAKDLVGASAETPVVLPVIGEVAAGHMPDRDLQPGTAIRIMTGAPIPPGADSVVRFEDTDEVERRDRGMEVAEIAIRVAVPLGANVRPTGEDVRAETVILEKGSALGPGHIGVLASLGRVQVEAIRRPTVAILATGDEVAEPGRPLGPGQIYNSNSYSVAALVQQLGAVPRLVGVARDTVESLSAKIGALRGFDFAITSAGVSVGYYDVVKEVLARHGQLDLWTVRMRPGKPVAFGVLTGPEEDRWPQSTPVVGLPGNPVSAMVVFHVLVRPALLKMMGRSSTDAPSVQAILEEPLRNSDGRRTYARAYVEKRDGAYYARLSGPQGSNILTAMARANGLAVCPEDIAELRPGDHVQVLLLE